MADSIFRKQSLDRVNSPEQLNDYIKTSKPSVWLVILAVFLLLTSLFIWGVFGSLDTSVSINGVATDSTVICFADHVTDIRVGNDVRIGDIHGTVLSISEKPVSTADAAALANTDDYTLYCLALAEWNYVVEIAVDGTLPNGFISADIVTDTVSPISFVFG